MSHVTRFGTLGLLALLALSIQGKARAEPSIKTVFVIAMENHNWTQPIKSQLTYTNLTGSGSLSVGAFDEGQSPSHLPRRDQQHDRDYEHQTHQTE